MAKRTRGNTENCLIIINKIFLFIILANLFKIRICYDYSVQ